MTQSACPDRARWQQLLRGQLAFPEAESLEEHLSDCADCLQTIRQLPAEDTLEQALRSPPSADGGEVPEAIHRLMKAWVAAAAVAIPGETARTATEVLAVGEPPRHQADPPTEEGFSFLAPPRTSGELGQLGGYRVLKVLGRGGMGVVFQARDMSLDRLVALKVMRPRVADSPDARQRFLREARACAALNDEHIVRTYQVGEDRGCPFIVMEYLEGAPLDRYLDSPLTIPQILRIGGEAAAGLAAAHDQGMIHRDIKPSNIWLDKDSGRVKLLDFGLARTAAESTYRTTPGAIVGTPAYMAPEQARGEPVDPRCDLFSLGCVLYQLAAGVVPFPGDTTMAVLMALATKTPKPVRDINPRIPAALSDLIDKMLQKDPQDRTASAQQVIRAIQAIEGGTNQATNLHADVSQLPPALGANVHRPAATGRKRWRRSAAVCLVPLMVLAAWVIVRDPEGREIARVRIPPDGSAEVRLGPDGGAEAVRKSGSTPEKSPAAKLPPPLAGQEIDLLAAVDPAQATSKKMKWQRAGAELAGIGIAASTQGDWAGFAFPPIIRGDYDLEIQFVQQGFYPLQIQLPLGDRAVCVSLSPKGSGLLLIDGKDWNDAPVPLRNDLARMLSHVPQQVIARVRHRGQEVEIAVTLEGVNVGHFVGKRSRIALPHWVVPDRQCVRFSAMGNLSNASLTFMKVKVVSMAK